MFTDKLQKNFMYDITPSEYNEGSILDNDNALKAYKKKLGNSFRLYGKNITSDIANDHYSIKEEKYKMPHQFYYVLVDRLDLIEKHVDKHIFELKDSNKTNILQFSILFKRENIFNYLMKFMRIYSIPQKKYLTQRNKFNHNCITYSMNNNMHDIFDILCFYNVINFNKLYRQDAKSLEYLVKNDKCKFIRKIITCPKFPKKYYRDEIFMYSVKYLNLNILNLLENNGYKIQYAGVSKQILKYIKQYDTENIRKLKEQKKTIRTVRINAEVVDILLFLKNIHKTDESIKLKKLIEYFENEIITYVHGIDIKSIPDNKEELHHDEIDENINVSYNDMVKLNIYGNEAYKHNFILTDGKQQILKYRLSRRIGVGIIDASVKSTHYYQTLVDSLDNDNFAGLRIRCIIRLNNINRSKSFNITARVNEMTKNKDIGLYIFNMKNINMKSKLKSILKLLHGKFTLFIGNVTYLKQENIKYAVAKLKPLSKHK